MSSADKEISKIEGKNPVKIELEEKSHAKSEQQRSDVPTDGFFEDPIQTQANLRESWPHSWDVYVVGCLATLCPRTLMLYAMYTLKYDVFAFTIVTLVYYAAIGLPILYLEMQLGQYCGGTSIDLFKNIVPLFWGLGWLMTFIAAFQCTPILIDFSELFMDMYKCSLKTCDLPPLPDQNVTEVDSHPDSNYSWQIALVIMFMFVAIAVTLSFKLKHIAYVYYFLAPLILVSFFVPFIRCLLLPHAGWGVKHLLTINLKQLTDVKIWADAGVITLINLNISMGVYHAIGSMNRFNFRIAKPVCTIVLMNMWASFMTTIFAMAATGVYVHYLANTMTLRSARQVTNILWETKITKRLAVSLSLAGLPYVGCFMLMSAALVYSTILIYIYPLVQFVTTNLPWKIFHWRPIASIIVCCTISVIPLLFVDKEFRKYKDIFYSAYELILWGVLVQVLAVCWFYGKYLFREKNAHSQMVESMAGFVFYCYLRFVVPFIMVVTIIFSIYHFDRPSSITADNKLIKAILIVVAIIVLLVIPAVWTLKQQHFNFKESLKPKDIWLPLPESHVTVRLLKMMDAKRNKWVGNCGVLDRFRNLRTRLKRPATDNLTGLRSTRPT